MAILREELLGEHDKASTPLMDALSRITEKIKKNEINIPKALSQTKDPAKLQVQEEASFDSIVLKMGTDTIRTILRNNIPENELLGIFKRSQQAEERLKPEPTIALAGRAAQVMAGLLEDLSTNHPILKKRTTWIYRLGQVVWSIVQIAIPDSFFNILFRRWIAVVYVAAILIIALGRFVNSELPNLGWQVLGTSAGIHLTILTFSSYLRGKQIHLFVKNLLIFIVGIVMAILIFIGLRHFNEDVLQRLINWMDNIFRAL